MTYVITFLVYYAIYTLGTLLATKCVKWVNYIDNKGKIFKIDPLDTWTAYFSWLTVAGALIFAIVVYIIKPIIKFVFYPVKMAVKKLDD